MIAVTFRQPTESDLDALAANMRGFDQIECRILGGHEPREALAEGVEQSLWSVAAEVDGQVVCVFGVAGDLLGEHASPWMLCAEGIERSARALLVFSRRFLAQMTEQFETLSNLVHADNRSAVRYLKWCGFEFGQGCSVAGEHFLPFTMKRAA